MSKLNPITDDKEVIGYSFYCPGCKCDHAYWINRGWKFNGDLNAPTFTPSLKNTYPDGRVCHLYIEHGKIKYCGDCFHELKTQTIELIDESTDPLT